MAEAAAMAAAVVVVASAQHFRTWLPRYYATIFPQDVPFDALDMCSSWVSHFPDAPKPRRLAVTGMNQEELDRNAQVNSSNCSKPTLDTDIA